LEDADAGTREVAEGAHEDDVDHQQEQETHGNESHEREDGEEDAVLSLPELAPAELGAEEQLRVLATTSIVGDVIAQVGGDAIALTILMQPGQDPHSYEPSIRDLTNAAEAHVVFVNGWDLEEGLADDLETIGEDVPVVPISANVRPLAVRESEREHEDEEHQEGEEGEGHEHDHGSADPHVWFSVHNVKQWVENVEQVLSDLDPANAEAYERNAASYLEALTQLEQYAEAQLATIPTGNRFLVTNHEALAYFAEVYDFTILGTVIPGASTIAEPSAAEMVALVELMEEHGICTIFAETTANDSLAQTVAGELDGCDNVQVLKIYTGSLGAIGTGADSYIAMMRSNIDMVVAGLTVD
jgi:ABC-type Zn uptake system ZnuABC Zn-binding protein ZnuA